MCIEIYTTTNTNTNTNIDVRVYMYRQSMRGTPYAHAMLKLMHFACGYALKYKLTLWKSSTRLQASYTFQDFQMKLLFCFSVIWHHVYQTHFVKEIKNEMKKFNLKHSCSIIQRTHNVYLCYFTATPYSSWECSNCTNPQFCQLS